MTKTGVARVVRHTSAALPVCVARSVLSELALNRPMISGRSSHVAGLIVSPSSRVITSLAPADPGLSAEQKAAGSERLEDVGRLVPHGHRIGLRRAGVERCPVGGGVMAEDDLDGELFG